MPMVRAIVHTYMATILSPNNERRKLLQTQNGFQESISGTHTIFITKTPATCLILPNNKMILQRTPEI